MAMPSATPTTLSRAVLDKVSQHPCYSPAAHHRYARMHLAVAPACNVQCHYCNRKYDCANESRPGVVSEVLTPEQAVKKTLAVAAGLWAVAFALYLVVYTPWLMRTRLDGKDG